MSTAGPGQARTASTPAPPREVCRVWWARPSDVRPEHDAFLADADLVRRARLVRAEDRSRLTAATAAARQVLGACLETSPRALEVDRTCPRCGAGHGKPRLVDAPSLNFSVAHSGTYVVVAVLPGSPVGVDVERVERFASGELETLADSVLAVEERAHLAHRSADDRPSAFTGFWVRKEAVLKATGQGLGTGLEELAVTPPSARPRVLRWDGAGPLWLRDLAAPPGYLGALAGLGEPPADVVAHDAGPLLRRTGGRRAGAGAVRQRWS